MHFYPGLEHRSQHGGRLLDDNMDIGSGCDNVQFWGSYIWSHRLRYNGVLNCRSTGAISCKRISCTVAAMLGIDCLAVFSKRGWPALMLDGLLRGRQDMQIWHESRMPGRPDMRARHECRLLAGVDMHVWHEGRGV